MNKHKIAKNIVWMSGLLIIAECGAVQDKPVQYNEPVAAYQIDYNAGTSVLSIKSIDVTPSQPGVNQTGKAGVFQSGSTILNGNLITAPVYITNNDTQPWTGVEMQAYKLLSGTAIVSNPDLGTGWFVNTPAYGAWGWLFTSGTAGSAYTIPAGGQSTSRIIGFSTVSSFVGWIYIYANIPVITGISSSGALTDSTITISGFNFSTTQGSVTFNGITATVTSWNPTSVVVTVPANATLGDIIIKTIYANPPYTNPVLFTPYSVFSNNPTIQNPAGITVDTTGNLYVAVYNAHNYIDKITSAGVIARYSNSGGGRKGVKYNWPLDVALDTSGNLYVANSRNNNILVVSSGGGAPSVFASVGTGPDALYFSQAGQTWPLFVANGGNGTISEVASNKTVIQFASGFTNPTAIATDASGNVYVGECSNGNVYKINSGGTVTTTVIAGLSCPAGMKLDSSGNIYVLDAGTNTMYKYILSTGTLSVYAAGTGIANANGGFAFNDTFTTLYISQDNPTNDITAIPLQ